MIDPVKLSGAKLLITGATGQVAEPVVAALAGQSEVTALARFAREEDRQRIAALGASCVSVDLADPEGLRAVPRDFDYVLNFAVAKSGDFSADLNANAEAAGRLMLHCREAQAFLHFSSTAVYQYAGHKPLRENAPLGDNHRAMFPTYSISKIAAETLVRFCARQFGLPATIARLSVPYGDNGGWPWYHLLMMKDRIPIDVHPESPNFYNLIHVDDYLEKIPRLLAAASTDATIVNLGGSERTSVEQWCAWLAELTGFEPVFRQNPQAFGSLCIDTTWMHELLGPTRVDWKDGIRSMVKNLAPQLLRPK
jgi:nucleoside-diphosphate-sugar epimerase